MYLGVHRKTLTEMQKLVFQCTRGSTGIFLYERPTINKMTLKYELILWIAFRDPWSPFNYNPEKLYNSDNHTSVKMFPVKISSDGSIQLLVLTESEIKRNYYTPYTTQHAEVFKTNCLKTLVSRLIVTALASVRVDSYNRMCEWSIRRVRYG